MMEKKKRMGLFFLVYFFYWAAENCLSPYLGLFYQQAGLSGTQIGLVSGVFSAAAVAASILIGLAGDRLRRPRLLIQFLLLGAIVATALLYLSPAVSVALIFPCVFAYGFFSSPVNGITDKVLMDNLTDKPEKFSFYRMGGTTGAGVGVILSGLFVAIGSPLGFIFAGYWLLMALCILSARPLPAGQNAPAEKTRLEHYGQILRHRQSLSIYGTYAAWGFTESSVTQFLALHIAACGYDSALTSVFVAVAMVGECLAFSLTPRLQKHLSVRTLISLGFVLQFLRIGSLALVGRLSPVVVGLFQFTGGGSFALIYSVITQQISQIYPPEISYSAHTLKYLANRGVGVTLGSLLLGSLFDAGRSVLAYGILALAAGVMVLLPRFYIKEAA